MHKTIFPAEFLADFGFLPVRAKGRVELARLELGGLQPVEEGVREQVLTRVREAFMPRPRAAALLEGREERDYDGKHNMKRLLSIAGVLILSGVIAASYAATLSVLRVMIFFLLLRVA